MGYVIRVHGTTFLSWCDVSLTNILNLSSKIERSHIAHA